MKPHFSLTCLAVIAILINCCNLSASTLLESWENTGVEGVNEQLGGPWVISEKLLSGIKLSYSTRHATNGDYSLAVHTPGGWSQIIMCGENSTSPLRKSQWHEILAGKLTVNLDVYFDDNLEWSKVEIAVQGNSLPWTQLSTNSLSPGATSVKYLIPPKVSAAFENCDEWFQLIIMVNTSGPGTVYIDNLSVE
jgi:hypothetical protein